VLVQEEEEEVEEDLRSKRFEIQRMRLGPGAESVTNIDCDFVYPVQFKFKTESWLKWFEPEGLASTRTCLHCFPVLILSPAPAPVLPRRVVLSQRVTDPPVMKECSPSPPATGTATLPQHG
jgi:hypothetical protein